jgi:hypothetical protein
MHSLKGILERGNPYGSSDGRRPVALSAGDVPDSPGNWGTAYGGPFLTYANNVFQLARNVIMWWTPARVEHEALRMAGDVEGPSVLSEEAYAFRAIYLQIASMIVESSGLYLMSVIDQRDAIGTIRYANLLRELLEEAVTTLERKAQQVEARATDLRARHDAQKLRAMLGALDVSPKLEKLIEAAQKDNESRDHLLQLAGEVSDALKQSARNTESIKLYAEWWWDGRLEKEADAKKVTTLVAKLGEKTGDALLKNLMAALIEAMKRQF